MSGPTLIYDPKAGGNVAANLNLASDGLMVFDPMGRKLQHWPYAEIVHVYAAGEGKDEVLGRNRSGGSTIFVQDDVIYNAIRARAPHLRRLRRGWRTFWHAMKGVPDEVRIWLSMTAIIAVIGAVSAVFGWFG